MYTSKLHVLGIDHGNGETKTVHTVFHSGVRNIVGDSLVENVLELEDTRRFVIGEQVPAYKNKKYEEESLYIQTLAAIATELEARGIEEDVVHIWLAVGLPIGVWNIQKSRTKEYLLKKREVSFIYKNKMYSIVIHGCNVMPQSLASSRCHHPNNKGLLYTIDIGNGTADYLKFFNNQLLEEQCGSEEYGVWKCYEMVKKTIMATFSENIEYFSFENYIKGETQSIASEWHPAIERAIKEYCLGIINILKRVEFNPKTAYLHVMGGGSHLLKKYDELLEGINVTFDLDVHSNARGFEWYCKKYLDGQGEEYYE